MAYASVAQADHEAVLRDAAADEDLSSPELPPNSSSRRSHTFDHPVKHAHHHSRGSSGGVGGLLKSLSSSHSYAMVEDDDYDEPQRTPMGPPQAFTGHTLPGNDSTSPLSESTPIRTASISRHLPLNHPTPDLQSLQGALVKNVERLEESAERLSSSMTSSLEEELDKMRKEQRRIENQSAASATSESAIRPSVQRQFSASSISNSIIGVNQTARNGGYSPSGYISSPTGSIRSGPYQVVERRTSGGSRRSNQFTEHPLEGRALEFQSTRRSSTHAITGQDPTKSPARSQGSIPEERPEERPLTSASNATSRQAEDAFDDFDGVHYNNAGPEGPTAVSRQISLRHPPLARDAKAYREAQPGEKMIYYPAPVPVMLNLPPRLSKANFAEQERRRLQALSGIPDEMRKSAAWLAEQDPSKLQEVANRRNTAQLLPPQLRASAFFDKPGVSPELQLKNGSAVQTLDSILDAAAHAPVSAFTDHPIIGQLGKEVYGPEVSSRKSMQMPDNKAKHKSSLSTLLKTRRSSTGLAGSRLSRTKSRDSKGELLNGDEDDSGDELDRAAAESISPDADEMPDDDNDVVPGGFNTAPTTLLAELQMRKEQQKLRNRTAADGFPNGMHSTLLELDAVTQLQQKARKTKHVTLAWEDHEEADKHNFDDDDVPLGVLYPEKDRASHFNMNKPLGLLEKREMEDSEPLSHRRARLRGEPYQPPKSDVQSYVDDGPSPTIGKISGLDKEIEEQEEETLAQRAQRIKSEKSKGLGGEFTDEVSSQLGLNIDSSKTPDPEETLGQRRQRLKEEALKKQANGMHNLASVLQAHPVGAQSRQVSGESRGLVNTTTNGPTRQQTHGPLLNFNNDAKFQAAEAVFRSPPLTNHGYTQHSAAYSNQAYGGYFQGQVPYGNGGFSASMPALYSAPLPTHMQYPMGYQVGYGVQPFIQDPMMGPPLDPKQRAQIDRWRQSIVQ